MCIVLLLLLLLLYIIILYIICYITLVLSIYYIYYIILYYIILYRIISYYIILYIFILYYIILYHIVLYCIIYIIVDCILYLISSLHTSFLTACMIMMLHNFSIGASYELQSTEIRRNLFSIMYSCLVNVLKFSIIYSSQFTGTIERGRLDYKATFRPR